MTITTQPHEDEDLALHVSLCAARFQQLERRLDRIEAIIIGANAALFAALLGLIMSRVL